MKNLIEVEVKGVAVLRMEGGVGLAVILKEKEGSRHLTIIIGPFEAKAISMALNGEVFSRPLTHDLLHEVIKTLGATVEKVIVNDLIDGTYYARIILNHEGRMYSIDARPSDSIALALRANAPVFVSSHVMDVASEYIPDLDEGSEWEGEGAEG